MENLHKLSFLKSQDPFVLRKYYLEGLRSKIFTILDFEDVKNETKGIKIGRIKEYPKAIPKKILRIMGHPFYNKEEIKVQIYNNEILKQYLFNVNGDLNHLALSEEIIVDKEEDIDLIVDILKIINQGRNDIFFLCGLQDYILGDIFDIYTLFSLDSLKELAKQDPPYILMSEFILNEQTLDNLQKSLKNFIFLIKKMVFEKNKIPDLGGTGNLKITPEGNIILVDINNVLDCFEFEKKILLDDHNIPSVYYAFEVLKKMHDFLGIRDTDFFDRFFSRMQLIWEKDGYKKRSFGIFQNEELFTGAN